MSFLQNNDPFPTVNGETVNHGPLSLPDELEQEWSVLLYYRGEW